MQTIRSSSPHSVLFFIAVSLLVLAAGRSIVHFYGRFETNEATQTTARLQAENQALRTQIEDVKFANQKLQAENARLYRIGMEVILFQGSDIADLEARCGRPPIADIPPDPNKR